MAYHYVVDARVSLHLAPVPGTLQPRSQDLSSSRPVSRSTGREEERPWERGWRISSGNLVIMIVAGSLALGHILPTLVFQGDICTQLLQ